MKIRRGAEGQADTLVAEQVLADPAPSAAPLVDIPYAFAKKNGVVLRAHADGRLSVALCEGADPVSLLEVRRYLAMPFDVEIAEQALFDRYLAEHYSVDGSAAQIVDEFTGSHDMLGDFLPTAEDLLDSADDAPVIRLINGIIAEAVRQGASDIHIEPYETGLVVRLRNDGVLEEKLRLPPSVAPVIVSRIKVMARLDIAERRVPQDGRIGLTLGGKLIDVRVSTLPSRAGERVVLRVLDKENTGMSLDLLGISDECLEVLTAALAEPNGIILVTGPTGSGKTTTLYAGLKRLNDGSRNILTVEDPVEYAVEGVGQTQVNEKVGMTFAAGLRAILRQDPDVVMVGEIRDRETADIAVQAALTGHLVLSTVHTNDAIGAVTRLRDMKIEPFLLASTLRAVVAQRLVRRLCAECREPVQCDNRLGALLGFEAGTVVYQATGCPSCKQTGYQGRIGVFEAVRVDETIRKIINAGGDEAVLAQHAFIHSPNLASAARKLVRSGETTPEEAIRISRSEEGGNA
jgi:general secretion pathway protein E